MTSLTDRQKQLIFDYAIGLTSERQNAQAQELIFSNEQAAELHTKLKSSLSPLDLIAAEPCPDELAEGAIWRFTQAVHSSQAHLETLLAAEQKRKVRSRGFWRDLASRLATAAVFIIVGFAVITGFRVLSSYTHQRYWQSQCASQLGSIFQGISNYRADNGDRMPAVATAVNSPWWKLGYQGPENHSNTRPMWLLVKGGYVNADEFVCPARRNLKTLQIAPATIKLLNDFPGRKFVTYSLRINCRKSPVALSGRKPIIADLNPIFENANIPNNSLGRFSVVVSDKLLKSNSSNHGGRGQNVLFCDGSVNFLKNRRAGVSMDDIFTLQNTRRYKGVELPTCASDAFLAP